MHVRAVIARCAVLMLAAVLCAGAGVFVSVITAVGLLMDRSRH